MAILREGQQLGSYRVVRRLGRGGMGEVYLAEHLRLGGRAALKVLYPEIAAEPENLARFRREGRSAFGLSHPHIIGIHDFDSDPETGHHFIAMEYVAGRSLAQVIEEAGRLDPARVVTISRQVLDALGAAHGQGIFHRDIKPDNILIDESGRAVITDFGIAKLRAGTQLTRTGLFVGTVQYTSPEQVKGGEIDGRSDLYSWGVVMYEMLAGRTPFAHHQTHAALLAHVNEEPPDLASLAPETPSALTAVVARALAKDPAERFADAAAMAAALPDLGEAPAHASALSAEPVPGVAAAAPAAPAGRGRGLLWAGLALAGLAAVALGWYLAQPGPPEGGPTVAQAPPAPREAAPTPQPPPAQATPAIAPTEPPAAPPEKSAGEGAPAPAANPPSARPAPPAAAPTSRQAQARIDAGLVKLALGDLAGAIRDLEAAAKASPGSDRAARALAALRERLARVEALMREAGAGPEEMGRLERALSGRGTAPLPLFLALRGWSKLAEGEKDDAKAIFTQALELNQAEPLARLGLRALGGPRAGGSDLPRMANSLGMEFVLIPAGEFTMGCGEDEGDDPHYRRHPVRLSRPFWLQTTEVTQAQWRAVMGANPSRHQGDPTRPVETVSWRDIQDFLARLNSSPGQPRYRLPSEAEWEYARRAGQKGPYGSAGGEKDLGGQAWYAANSGGTTHPVGRKAANPWGLFDMQGNVWEWCADFFGQRYYADSPGQDPPGPAKGQHRVLRGGSYHEGPWHQRACHRGYDDAEDRFAHVGLRLARDP